MIGEGPKVQIYIMHHHRTFSILALKRFTSPRTCAERGVSCVERTTMGVMGATVKWVF